MTEATAADRRLVLVRHAKSDWPDVPDAERPLAKRGRRDAPAVGRWLRGAGLVPDRVVCSTAKRARETWKLAAPELRAKPSVSYDDRVYDAEAEELLGVIRETPAEIGTLVLVGHNPGMQRLALALAGSAKGDALERAKEAFPTSCVAVLSFTGAWPDVGSGDGYLLEVAAPRG